MERIFVLLSSLTKKALNDRLVNIHTHRPTGCAVEPTFGGVHPWQAAERFDAEALRRAVGDAQMVGEIGLDYACGVDRELQMRLFRAQLRLAEELRRPVVIHCVKAFEQVMRELRSYRLRAVVFHGFIGSAEQAARAVDAGYYLSFGARAFRSPRTVEALRRTPLDRLFAETDDSGEPIGEIYRRIAQIIGIDTERLEEEILRNYRKIFER
ncbi:MAG: TatD family hydrolase [Alistipes sp.]|nr:TatD family hydrolase [Alistipes sp.]